MAKGTNRDQGRETTWRRIIREQARSRVAIRQFCRDNALTESAFYFWRRELQRREASQEQQPRTRRAPRTPRAVTAPAFVPVAISPQARSDSARIEVVLPGGVRLHVGAGVERQALADVVAVLREARAC